MENFTAGEETWSRKYLHTLEDLSEAQWDENEEQLKLCRRLQSKLDDGT